jgi:nitrous oxide reductase accessory protein NosL
MKKTSFVIAILASALLAGACGKKKDAAAPTPPATETVAPTEGAGDGTAPAEGAGDGSAPAEGAGSGM